MTTMLRASVGQVVPTPMRESSQAPIAASMKPMMTMTL